MKNNGMVYTVGFVFFLIVISMGKSYALQTQSPLSIPKFEIDQSKYKLQQNIELRNAKNDSIVAGSLANLRLMQSSMQKNIRRRFTNIKSPLLDSPQPLPTGNPPSNTNIPAASSALFDDMASATATNIIAEFEFSKADTIFDSDDTEMVLNLSQPGKNSKNYIPWNAAAGLSLQGSRALLQETEQMQNARKRTAGSRDFDILRPNLKLRLQMGISAVVFLIFSLLLLPSVRVRLYFMTGNYKNAIQIGEKLLKRNPHHTKLYTMLAYAYFSSDWNNDKAIAMYEKVLLLEIDFSYKDKINEILADRYLRDNRMDEFAIDVLESALGKELKGKNLHAELAT